MNKRYVFVSGAAGGIGMETTILLAKKGYHVFAGDINLKALENKANEKIIPIHIDITNSKSIEDAILQIKKLTTQLKGLINIAGAFDQFPLVEVDHSSFENLINVNLIGHQKLTRALFPLLFNAKGRVINLSSETVLAQMPLQSYGFTKKLFDMWNTQLRMEMKLLGMEGIVIRAGGHQTHFIKQSSSIISDIDKRSRYSNLLHKINQKAQKLLNEKQSDPADLAAVFFKALTLKRPKKTYYVNVSLLFNFLSLLPSGLREYLMVAQLKRWM